MRPCLVQSTMLQLGSLLHQHVRDIARRCAVVPWHAQWSILGEETSRRTWCGASVEVLIRLWRTPCDARRAQVSLFRLSRATILRNQHHGPQPWPQQPTHAARKVKRSWLSDWGGDRTVQRPEPRITWIWINETMKTPRRLCFRPLSIGILETSQVLWRLRKLCCQPQHVSMSCSGMSLARAVEERGVNQSRPGAEAKRFTAPAPKKSRESLSG